jgi:hypothetical protein
MIKTINGEFRDREHYIRFLETKLENIQDAWEELKEYHKTMIKQLRHENWAECERVMFVGTNNSNLKMQELAKKYGLDKER